MSLDFVTCYKPEDKIHVYTCTYVCYMYMLTIIIGTENINCKSSTRCIYRPAICIRTNTGCTDLVNFMNKREKEKKKICDIYILSDMPILYFLCYLCRN